ncbi:MAG: hypothetical protein KGH98_04710 [Candidatus Micrarchaeota archaeon]|nr:hypothetical protein [Candidatus Micrarchaeota archaeon]
MAGQKVSKKMLVLYIFIALALISSYAAFGNNSGQGNPYSTTTTTITQGQGVFMIASANVTITGYSQAAELKVAPGDNKTYGIVSDMLGAMEANGTISTYIQGGNSFSVLLSQSPDAYTMQRILASNSLNVTVIANSTVRLPAKVTFLYGKQEVPVDTANQTGQAGILPLREVGSVVPATIHAVVSQYGQIVGQLRVIYNGTG